MQTPSITSPTVALSARRWAWLPEIAWWAFLGWTAIGFVVMPLGIGEEAINRWLPQGLLKQSIAGVLHVSDAVWIVLAAIVIYVYTAANEGLPTARLWATIILVTSACFEWIGTRTGFPFGPYRYTDHFGWRLGGVLPVAIPLAWMVVVLCGRYLVLWFRPASTRWELALGVAVVATLTDINLEIVAWKVRGYWLWYPDTLNPPSTWPPLQNYLSWFALSFLLTFFLPPNHLLRMRRPGHARPILVLTLMNALFIVVYLVHWVRLTG